MLLKVKFYLCSCPETLEAVVVGSCKSSAVIGHFFCIRLGLSFEGFDYVNISGIKFLSDLDNRYGMYE